MDIFLKLMDKLVNQKILRFNVMDFDGNPWISISGH